MLKSWLSAARPKTLPLALSCIITGSAIAYVEQRFSAGVFLWAVLTTVLLQILSNFANDLGDSIKGTDNEFRVGPLRTVQSGEIGFEAMKKAVMITAVLSLLSGLQLLWTAFGALDFHFFGFLMLGLMAIGAAVVYTVGKGAYGYKGWGDAFVLVFFGWTGVLGVLYLHGQPLYWLHWLPATAIGLLAVGVLNLNNLRDIDNDRNSGKMTLAVRLGRGKARIYHLIIADISFLSMVLYASQGGYSWAYLALLGYIPVAANVILVFKHKEPSELIPALKQLALSTFLVSVLFAISMILQAHAG